MARPKKELVPAAPLSVTAQLVASMQKDGIDVDTIAGAMRKWRYVDFVNPRARLPSLSLEWFFGARGLLAGRIMQLRAKFSKGKSSYMYLEYAMAQLMSQAFCMHIETEGAQAPADYVASFGANPDEVLTRELKSLEDCLITVDDFICRIRGGEGGSISDAGRVIKTRYTDPYDKEMTRPIMIGIDSLSSLGKDDMATLDVLDVGDTPQISYHANRLRSWFRNRADRLRRTQTVLMLASQETANIKTGKAGFGGGGGGGEKSALAQDAIASAATLGIDVDSSPLYDKERGTQVGDTVTLYTFKNKISPRYRRIQLPLIWNEGFDLVRADWEFLSAHPASPFAPQAGEKPGLYKHSHGISCKALSDKSFANELEFLQALYTNADLTASLREKMRIRGCGFDFEVKYLGKEIPNALTEGDAGSLDTAVESSGDPDDPDA